MSVDGQVAVAAKIPTVILINLHPHQVRHDAAQAVIMIPLHPYHLYAPLGVGEFANIAQKFPVWLRQTCEIQVGEDIAQQNQPPEPLRAQHTQRILSPADRGAEMQI